MLSHLSRIIVLVGLMVTLLAGSVITHAAPAEPVRGTKTLHAFDQPPSRPDSLLRGSDGNFYGLSQLGGFGALFRVTPAGVFSIVHDFKDDRAGFPKRLVLGKDGNLYGVLSGYGAIFRCSLTGNFSIIHTPGRGDVPGWLIAGSDGNLYGTTQFGGAAKQGSVFRLTPAGQVTTIHTFSGGSGPLDPYELVEGPPGTFYGTCYSSLNGNLAFFRVTAAGDFDIVRDLTGTSYGGPSHLVYGGDGNIYGFYAQPSQPSQPAFSLFRLTPSGDLTLIHDLGSAYVTAITKGADGNLYCSTSGGTGNVGAVERATLSGQVTTLYSFTGKDDGYNPGALSFVPGEGLFGVTPQGSVGDCGTVFHLNPSNQFTTLVRFGMTGKGYAPNQALLQASDGSLFGMTNLGGSGGYGTIYHLNLSGERETLHEFGGDSGAYPSLLVMAGDGRLYGASTGVEGKGSVYRIDATGAFTLLHEFTDGDDGSHPVALVASHDGNVYGVSTSALNSGKYGSFFRITPAGAFKVVKVFDGFGGQTRPIGLVEAKDGNLYGLVSRFNSGTLFRITPDGVKTDLHTFAAEYVSEPANLTAGTDGNLYGTRPGYRDGSHGGLVVSPGSTWQCSPSGAFRTIHTFNGSDGLFRPTSVVQASDGNLYGIVGRASGGPTTAVYRLTPEGVFTPIYQDIPTVLNMLEEGVDGRLYGTAANFTVPSDGGRVFRLIFGAPGAVNLATRMLVGTGDYAPIGGFIVTGNVAKKVMLRGIGPSLDPFGEQRGGRPPFDPVLELHDASGTIIGRNDNWRTSELGGVVAGDQAPDIKASGLAPLDDHEPALIATLNPGSYTAVVSGQHTSGIGLVELYDLDVEADARLANLSTRGFAGSSDSVLIGGLIVDGSVYSRCKVIIRAIGPSLSQFGIAQSLQDPSLTVYDQNGNRQAVNDNWQDGNQPEIIAHGLAPKDSRESAVYLSLAGGHYTAIVSGKAGATGVALVETYNVQ